MNKTMLTKLTILFPLTAFGFAAATTSVRDQVGATNVGVILAMVVVLAALGGRWAGLSTAAAAALSFNFFHTEPYHSLRIHSSRDAIIVALLAVLGLVVSDITAWRRRHDTIAFRHGAAAGAPETVAALLTEPHAVGDVWPAVASTIMDQLSLAECWYAPRVSMLVPLISRVGSRAADGDDGFVLPSGGAAIAVVWHGTTLGHLVIRPKRGITSLWVERRVVVALADHLAIALTYTGHARATSAATDAR